MKTYLIKMHTEMINSGSVCERAHKVYHFAWVFLYYVCILTSVAKYIVTRLSPGPAAEPTSPLRSRSHPVSCSPSVPRAQAEMAPTADRWVETTVTPHGSHSNALSPLPLLLWTRCWRCLNSWSYRQHLNKINKWEYQNLELGHLTHTFHKFWYRYVF